MAREFQPKVVTANDLLEGDVVYLTAANVWSRYLGNALILTSPDDADRHLAIAAGQEEQVVGPYLADVEQDVNGAPVPVHFREIFRTRGPSNYVHGKQEEAFDDVPL